MSDEPKRSGTLQTALAVGMALMVGAGSGMFVQRQMDEKNAVVALLSASTDRQHERDAAALREKNLNQIIENERRLHVTASKEGHEHLRAFTVHAARVRNELETMLADSRRDKDSCTGRIGRISENVGQLDELLGQSVGLLEDGQIEIGKLKAENGRILDKFRLLQCYEPGPERITVTGKK